MPASIAYFLQEFPGGFAGERLRFHLVVKPTITQYAAEIFAFDVNYRSDVSKPNSRA